MGCKFDIRVLSHLSLKSTAPLSCVFAVVVYAAHMTHPFTSWTTYMRGLIPLSVKLSLWYKLHTDLSLYHVAIAARFRLVTRPGALTVKAGEHGLTRCRSSFSCSCLHFTYPPSTRNAGPSSFHCENARQRQLTRAATSSGPLLKPPRHAQSCTKTHFLLLVATLKPSRTVHIYLIVNFSLHTIMAGPYPATMVPNQKSHLVAVTSTSRGRHDGMIISSYCMVPSNLNSERPWAAL
jgi:hypothetical protein